MTAWVHSLRLQPGQRDSIVRSPRPDLAALLAVGQPAALLPERMAALHALCAHGHRLAATLALRAARGETATCSVAERAELRHAVAREQLLRITHDWPRLLPGAPAAAPSLQGCPLWDGTLAPAQQLQALPHWLQQRWQRQPVALLAAVLPRALTLRTPRPSNAMPDTGPWNRRNSHGTAAADNAGMRLIARLQDLLRLAEPGGEEWLFAEAQSCGERAGHASVEVGRGLLQYHLCIDQEDIVRELRVQSPTDTNFHPNGLLAATLRNTFDADDARLLAVAFDPCEPFEVALQAETADA